MGTRARSGPSWVQAWRAAGQMPAPPLPRPPAPGFPPLENEPERWPASRTRRDNAGTCTPEVDAAGASGGPSYRAPRDRNRRAPSLRGGAWSPGTALVPFAAERVGSALWRPHGVRRTRETGAGRGRRRTSSPGLPPRGPHQAPAGGCSGSRGMSPKTSASDPVSTRKPPHLSHRC